MKQRQTRRYAVNKRSIAGNSAGIVVDLITIITRFVSSLPSLKVESHQAIAAAGKDTAANAAVHIQATDKLTTSAERIKN